MLLKVNKTENMPKLHDARTYFYFFFKLKRDVVRICTDKNQRWKPESHV